MKNIASGVCKLTKYLRKRAIVWKKLHSWQNFYTTTGPGGRDKYQLCV